MNDTNLILLKRCILFCFVILSSSITLVGQGNSAPSKNLNFEINKVITPDGDLDNNITCVKKDKLGFMWFGTTHGLYRYDGVKAIRFSTSSASSITANTIHQIIEDDQGYLWVLNKYLERDDLKDNKMFFVNIHTLEVKNYAERFNGDEFNFDNRISNIYEGNDNVIYFSKGDLKLIHKFEDGLFTDLNLNLPNKLNDSEIYDYYRYVSKIGVDLPGYFQMVDKSFQYNLGLNENNDLIIIDAIRKPNVQRNEITFVNKDDTESRLTLKDFLPRDLNMISVSGSVCKFNSSTNNIWHTNGLDFVLFNSADGYFFDFRKEFPEIFNETIFDIYIDENELVWVCTNSGVYKIKIKQNHFQTYLSKEKGEENPHSTRSIYTKDNKEILVASVMGLLKITEEGISELAPYNCSPFYPLDDDELLTGSYFLHELKGDSLKVLVGFNKINTIWDIHKDKDGAYWLALEKGLGYWEGSTDSITLLSNFKAFEELKYASIFDILLLQNGNQLLSTTLGVFEISSNKIINRYWKGGTGKQHLPLNECFYAYEDSDGIVWLGTNGEGVIKWEKEKGTFEVISKEDGLSHNVVCTIYEDDDENLWIPTYHGLSCYNKNTKQINIYTEDDGITDNEFNRISHFKAYDGKYYFGGMNGVNSFYPSDLIQKKDTTSYPLYLTGYDYFDSNSKTIISGFNEFKQDNKIYLDSKKAYVDLEFSLLDYQNKTSRYSYTISGLNNEWYEITENKLKISGLPYGKYDIIIRGQMANGEYSKSKLVVPIVSIAPFYFRWWFVLACVAILIFSVIQFLKYRTRLLKVQKEELKKQVALQTEQLQEDKNLIEKQAEKLLKLDSAKTKFFANVSHELRTPVTLIKGPVQSVLNKGRLNEEDTALLETVNSGTDNLLGLVNELLDLTRLEADKIELEEAPVSLHEFLKRKIINFQSHAEIKGLELIFTYLPKKELHLLLDKDKLDKILNNLLSNAFKFTDKNGRVELVVEELEKTILMKVKDTGRGIPAEDLPYVFNRFYQSSLNMKAEGGLGIGLSLSMEFVKLFNGKMWVESNTNPPNNGTQFLLEIPKKIALDYKEGKEDFTYDTEVDRDEFLNRELVEHPEGYTILVLEDHLDLKKYLEYLLSPHYKVVSKGNGKEAFDWLKEGNLPSLILSDYMMPIMDGYEFLQKVKRINAYRNIPFVMLTARMEMKDKLNALRVGVDDYLTKPFTEEELMVRIKNLLINNEARKTYSASISEGDGDTANEDQIWLTTIENKIKEELNKHYFTIDYLAESLGINRDKLFKKTKTLTGLTPNQYVRTIRLQLAKEALEAKTFKTVKEVALHVGFQKADYFSSLFKKAYGKSPSEYLN